MKPLRFAAAALAFCALSAQAVNVRELALQVDCSAGESLSSALDRPVAFERRVIVTVKGVCVENVVIERDDVTLRGADTDSAIQADDATRPAVLVNGARRIALEGISIRGGLHGLMVISGAAAAFRGGRVTGAAVDGIRVEDASSVAVDQSLIESNTQSGISARAAVLRLTRSTVRNNGLSGVYVIRGAEASLGGTEGSDICCGNVIENNVLDGVTVAQSAGATLYGNTIRGNGLGGGGRFGILVVQASSARMMGGNVVQRNGFVANNVSFGGGVYVNGSALRVGFGDVPLAPAGNEISGNAVGINVRDNGAIDLRAGLLVLNNHTHGILLNQGSRLRAEGITVAGNAQHGIIAVRASSADMLGNANFVNGNQQFGLFCGDAESSHSGNLSGITGNLFGQVSCTGF